MTVTSAGYTGTVSETQWSRLFDACPYWCDGVGGIVGQVAGQRQVYTTDGAVFGRGVRDVIASEPAIALAPPASGGLWYLLVIRRTWGAGAASRFVSLVGPTTDGTVPTKIPTGNTLGAASAGPNNFQQNPGVVDDQGLAWVHVRAADTTLTIFDVRTLKTAAGSLGVVSWHALNWLKSAGFVSEGAIVETPNQTTPSGYLVRAVRWLSTSGVFIPESVLRVEQGSGSGGLTGWLAAAADLITMKNWYAALAYYGSGNDGETQMLFLGIWGHVAGDTQSFVVDPGPNTFVHVFWNSSTDITLNGGNWTSLPFDTIFGLDPLGIRQDQYNYKLPLNGRWAAFFRMATTANDTAARYLLAVSNVASGDMVWAGANGTWAESPLQMYGEFMAAAGDTLQAKVYRSSTGSMWAKGGNASASRMERPELILRYLGPR